MVHVASAWSATAAPTQQIKVVFVQSTVVAIRNYVRLLAAPPKQQREACAVNTAQEASALSATAAPTHGIKMAFVGGTAGQMGSVLHQVVALLLYLAKMCGAPSTAVAARNHVRLMAAPPKHKQEACAVNMAHVANAWSATAAPTHKRKVDSVGSTGGGDKKSNAK